LSVIGVVNPLMLKPVPEVLAADIVTLAVPEFWTVTDWVLLLPTTTFPNGSELGDTEICGCTPVPVRLIIMGEFVALLTTETFPDTLPVTAGENTTVIDALCPVVRVKGKPIPVAVKPAPVTVT
jgi:hypothetical protein